MSKLFWRLWSGAVGGDHYPACLVTAIGLTTGTARYFNQTTGASYGLLVTLSLMVSAALAVLGLNSHRNGGSRAVRHLSCCAGRGCAGHRSKMDRSAD